MKRMSCDYTHRGLTLVELMITLVILSATVTAATPAMQHLLHGSRLRTETSRLLDALNLARSEAVNRNVPVSICPSALSATGEPGCSGTFADGWMVFANRGRDGVYAAESDEVIRAFVPIPPGYALTNLAGTRPVAEPITYLPDGSSRRNLTLLVCPPGDYRLKPWRVVLNTVGRPRAAKGDGQCPGGAL